MPNDQKAQVLTFQRRKANLADITVDVRADPFCLALICIKALLDCQAAFALATIDRWAAERFITEEQRLGLLAFYGVTE